MVQVSLFLCSSLLDLQATQYPLQMNLEIEKNGERKIRLLVNIIFTNFQATIKPALVTTSS